MLQARKALRRLKGTVRLQTLAQGYPIKKQSTTTLSLIHSWCNIQTQIKARRLCMVTEGRVKQKKLMNQQKLEAKLHDIEVRSPVLLCGSFDKSNISNSQSQSLHLVSLTSDAPSYYIIFIDSCS